MIKKTITYTDYNGTERTEDFFFHLNKPELTKMIARFYPDVLIDPNANDDGYLLSVITKIIENKSPSELVELFEYVLLESYGKKSADGREFEKTPELKKQFSQTPAYDEMFVELLTQPDEMSKFFDGIMAGRINAQMKEKLQGLTGLQLAGE